MSRLSCRATRLLALSLIVGCGSKEPSKPRPIPGTGGSTTQPGTGGTMGGGENPGSGGSAPATTGGSDGSAAVPADGGATPADAAQPGGSDGPLVHPPRPDAAPVDPNCIPSKLYGKDGELWKPDGRLIDGAYAGYHTGLDPIPVVGGPVKKVTDFGAKPDDAVDDTDAFRAALAGTPSGVLLIPAGRYILSKQLIMKDRSNLVLRGEGIDKSVLYFPRPLTEVGETGQSWSFNGGFIHVEGTDAGPLIGDVTANAARGASELKVSATAGVTVGQWVRVVQTDANGSLLSTFYGGMFPGNVAEDGNTEIFHFYSLVKAVGPDSITLERPLPVAVDTRWKPQVLQVMPTAREMGVEELTLEMAPMKYPGHFMERGYNGIYFTGAHDSWVRNVRLVNAELGISIYHSFFCTVTGAILDGNVDESLVGHHGLNSARGSDNFFTLFELRRQYVHDLTVDGYAIATVWSKGKGVDMNMDHHGRAATGTLWTNLDLGKGTRAFDNGGASNRLPPTGAYTTVWNVHASGAIGFPPSNYGPLMNFVGSGNGTGPASWSIENIDRTKLCQPDLHDTMLAKRP
jgi:hypothetical protein